MPPRRFPAPWSIERITGGWRVRDAAGQTLAYTYGETSPARRVSPPKPLPSMSESRRIAVNIARLPELLRPPRG
jgi:hypothetical protein